MNELQLLNGNNNTNNNVT